jgi:50S ribosomal protein L16 3-hydroxylase
MRLLADRRRLGAKELGQLTGDARDLLDQWVQAGWLHPDID